MNTEKEIQLFNQAKTRVLKKIVVMDIGGLNLMLLHRIEDVMEGN